MDLRIYLDYCDCSNNTSHAKIVAWGFRRFEGFCHFKDLRTFCIFDKFEGFEGFMGLRILKVLGFQKFDRFYKLDMYKRLKV